MTFTSAVLCKHPVKTSVLRARSVPPLPALSEGMGTFRAKDWHQAGARITAQGFLLSMPVCKLSFSWPQPLAMSFVLFLNFLESHV